MKVTTAELRKVFVMLMDHLDESGHSEVEIDEDFYWSIPEAQCYQPNAEPTDMTLGQLSDDLSEIRGMLTKEKEPLAYGLVWLSAVLRRVGERVVG